MAVRDPFYRFKCRLRLHYAGSGRGYRPSGWDYLRAIIPGPCRWDVKHPADCECSGSAGRRFHARAPTDSVFYADYDCASSFVVVPDGSSEPLTLGLGLARCGVSVGNRLVLPPLSVAERFGLLDYSRLFSWANLFSVLGVAGGPGVLGAIYGSVGNFAIPYFFASAMGVVAALCFLGCVRVGK